RRGPGGRGRADRAPRVEAPRASRRPARPRAPGPPACGARRRGAGVRRREPGGRAGMGARGPRGAPGSARVHAADVVLLLGPARALPVRLVVSVRAWGGEGTMPLTPHVEQHFTAGAVVRDAVIGVSDG